MIVIGPLSHLSPLCSLPKAQPPQGPHYLHSRCQYLQPIDPQPTKLGCTCWPQSMQTGTPLQFGQDHFMQVSATPPAARLMGKGMYNPAASFPTKVGKILDLEYVEMSLDDPTPSRTYRCVLRNAYQATIVGAERNFDDWPMTVATAARPWPRKPRLYI